MRTQEIAYSFVEHCSSRGYHVDPPAPLVSDDPTLLFTNSSIAPYKRMLLSGAQVGARAQVQPCFRANSKIPLHSFTMLGLLADAEHLTRVIADTCSFLRRATPAPGDLLLAACADDMELAAAWWRSSGEPMLSVRWVGRRPGVTTWTYGEGDALTGRGGAVLWRDARRRPHAGCDLGCPCGRIQIVGTIIIVTSPRASSRYVESALGLEYLAATHVRGDLHELQEYAGITRALRQGGLTATAARLAAADVVASARLLAAGCATGPRGAGFVLRAMIRRIAPEAVAALAAHGDCDPRVLCELRSELAAREARSRSAVVKARRFVENRRRSATESELCATFGLTPELARAVLAHTGAP